ncbi:hypothetical protein C8J55DRAFT_555042 [Lentinula edodes]|uniref:Uncharacterized protein n=1 Tax=Lentinula lateritia TaxID=40482 RepID=A0A9W9AYK8_9AGAR|nr:hypothetical protein C8J55DRAFT_555042 [Lentinula edodes]
MPKDMSSNLTSTNEPAAATKAAPHSRKKKKPKFVKMEVEFGQSASVSLNSAAPFVPLKAGKVEKVWWEAWMENRSVRSLFCDQDAMHFQRISDATMVFNKNRLWPSTETQVRNRWDQFQVYVGLLNNAVGDDFLRLTNFVQNPARVIQIYLSSYFIEKGLHFSKYNCDIIPKLLYFYVNFLVVNEVLPDKGDDLHYALSIIDMAKTELALYPQIGESCPDHFNLTCKELLCNDSQGTLSDTNGTLADANAETQIQPDSIPVSPPSPKKTKKKKKKSQAKPQAMTEASAENSIESSANFSVSVECDITSPAVLSGWGGTAAAVEPGFWGEGASSGWGNTGPASISGWGVVVDTPPAPLEDIGWGSFSTLPPASSFVSAQITRALPKTHIRGVVEHAVRRVKAIIPPLEQNTIKCKQEDNTILNSIALEDELKRCYWTVVLEPWPIEGAQESISILSTSRGNVDLHTDQMTVEDGSINDLYVGSVKPHNCLSDDITIFLEDETRKVLRLGMGLGGTWVQLLRASDCAQHVKGREEEKEEEEEEEKSPNERRYWFLLEVLRILPSYYIV